MISLTKRTLSTMLVTMVTAVLSFGPTAPADEPMPPKSKHLFILSGQSNMVGMDPELSFIPTVSKAFGKDGVIIVKDAASGQSIRSWCKSNHEFPPPTTGRVPKVRGELYDRLIKKVTTAIKGQAVQTTTLVWMQGESDLNNTAYDAYLKELRTQLESDLKIKELHMVIGRISDSGLDVQKRLEGRLNIRRIQKEFAESQPKTEWVDTDDLNDRKVDDKVIHDLHYHQEGYRILGERFAKKSIGLIQQQANQPSKKAP